MKHLASVLFTAATCATSLANAGVQESETIAIGHTPAYAASDPVTGRLFVANGGVGRTGAGGSIFVLDRDGRQSSAPTSAPPMMLAVSALYRKVIVGQTNCDCIAIVDADTLSVRSVAGTTNPRRVVVSDATGFAYVLSYGLNGTAGTSTITAIDLRTGQSTTHPVAAFAAVDMVANAAGTRLYVIGMLPGAIARWPVGFLQAFDTASKAMIGSPVVVGRQPRQISLSTLNGDLYITGHADLIRTNLPVDATHRNSIRPSVFVVDAASLAVKRTIDLPDTTNLNLYGPSIMGQTAVDASTDVLYVLDSYNRKFSIVNPASDSVSVVDLEGPGLAIEFNPVAATVLVSLNQQGFVAVHSRTGERLDTVPIGRAAPPGVLAGLYTLTVDAIGTAYALNTHDNSISILPLRAGGPAVVNLTDLWSNPAEPGWGVFAQQQGAVLFAALFTHDAAGAPVWVVMPNGGRQPDGSFIGNLYRTRGPVANALENAVAVGTMRFAATSLDAATLSYSLDGAATTKVVTRLAFGAAPRNCAWSLDTRKAALSPGGNFTSLWWNPAQAGWGLALSQQGDTAFAVLFGYDASNRGSWTVMANGGRKSLGAFGGTLYRASAGNVVEAGDMSLAFSNADEGKLTYRLDGVDFTQPIVRQEFSMPASRCSS